MRVVICTLWLFLSAFFAEGQDCTLRKDRDSIRVYTCHNEGSKFKLIKAEFTVEASMSQLVAIFLDAEFYTQWQYNTIKAKLVKKINDHEIIYYSEIAAPWPVSNRDMVSQLKVEQDARTKEVVITAKGIPDYLPAKKGIVRVPMSQSKWTINKAGPNKLKVAYVIQIDPGGAVPAWMVNLVCADAPYQSFKNLRQKVKTSRFSDAIIARIEN